MHFYLPRRHRRKLLFPPGLLALAGLLWLGVVTLNGHPERLVWPNVIQLNMLPIEGLARQYYSEESLSWPRPLNSLEKIAAFRHWSDVKFTENLRANLIEQTHLIAALKCVQSDTLHAGGIRIRFTTAARYKDLIFSLDLVMRKNVKKYWLDIQHGPATLYIITFPIRLPH